MTLLKRLIDEHVELRHQARGLRAALDGRSPALGDMLKTFQDQVQNHFRLEEPFYRILDADKRVADRGLMHQLRNDHAAVLFSMESLAIRLRKHGPNDEWRQRLESLLGVLLPHLDLEEQKAFSLADQLLSPDEKARLAEELKKEP